ncbi:MAG: flavodoxin [Lachnospiraceae bacterium]|nr:flavodoxin [Lachnospiraceae bacterium]
MEILPAVNQMECNPDFQQKKLRKYLNQYGICMEAWYPLGHADKKLLTDERLAKIASKHHKSVKYTNKAKKMEEMIMAKNLIIYYSRKGQNYWNGGIKNIAKGNTEIVAEFIQKAVGGDLFEVETVKTYAEDYYACIDDAKAELRANARPELKKYLEDISEYENVFVCGPCWWGTYPMAVFTQLEKLDFTGKKVMAVMTHEGSGLGSCERDLKKLCKGATFGKGLAVHGADAAKSENTVTTWAKKSV